MVQAEGVVSVDKIEVVLRIQDRKHKSALNLFRHLSEAVEVQGILFFQELDCDVAVGSDVRLGQVFRLLQKPVIQKHAVVGQRKLLVPDLALEGMRVVRFLGVPLCGVSSVTHDHRSFCRNPEPQHMGGLCLFHDMEPAACVVGDSRSIRAAFFCGRGQRAEQAVLLLSAQVVVIVDESK